MWSAMGAPMGAMTMVLVLLASTASAENPSAPEAANPVPSTAPARPVIRDRHVSVEERIEQRVRLMARTLDLNADQQRKLRAILTDQRNQVQKIRSEPSIAPEDRIGALRSVNQKTVERIRALLDEEQRKKFSPPPPPARPAGTDPVPAGGASKPAESPPQSQGAQ